MNSNIFEWQVEVWDRLLGQPERLPHAVLIAGAEGSGKSVFAKALAGRLLCEIATGTAAACGSCPSCKWFEAGNHPDFRLLEPGGGAEGDESADESMGGKKRGEQIRIDQVRELAGFLNVGTHRGKGRIVMVVPAEAMNAATANSLLKILEEPNASTLFLIVSNNARKLLPTIRSRCRSVSFPRPDAGQAAAWLAQNETPDAANALAHAGGMPLMVLREQAAGARLSAFLEGIGQIGESGPLSLAAECESWLKEGREEGGVIDKRMLVVWLQKWIFDLVLLKLGGCPTYHPSQAAALRDLATRASAAALIDCYNELLRMAAVAQHPLNPRLFLEDMLSRYARAAAGSR